MKIKNWVILLVAVSGACHDVSAQNRSRLYTGGVAQIQISVAQKNGIGYRGPYEENVRSILQAPAVAVIIKDAGKIANFVHMTSGGKAKICGYSDKDEVDAVVSSMEVDGNLHQFLVIRKFLYDPANRMCYDAPQFVLRAIDI